MRVELLFKFICKEKGERGLHIKILAVSPSAFGSCVMFANPSAIWRHLCPAQLTKALPYITYCCFLMLVLNTDECTIIIVEVKL